MNIEEKHYEIIKRLAKKPELIKSEITLSKLHMVHMALGLAGEAGEVSEAIYLDKDRQSIIKELGDYEFYWRGICYDIRTFANVSKHINHSILPGTYSYRRLANDLIDFTLKFVDEVKKYTITNNDQAYLKMIDLIQPIERTLLCIRKGLVVSRSEVLLANIDKLSARYGSDLNYSDKASSERIDVKQLDEVGNLKKPCPAHGCICEHFSYMTDKDGRFAITHCSHPDNPVDEEGNTIKLNCPIPF